MKINEPSQQEGGERRKKSSKAETWQEFLDSELLLAELKVIEKKKSRIHQPAHVHL